jgi:hypothetical protein
MMQDKDILSDLFDSPVKVKALKLFLRNPIEGFSVTEGALRLKLTTAEFGRQVKKFCDIDLVRSRVMSVQKKTGKRVKNFKERIYFVNPHFLFYEELRNLVLKSSPTAWNKKLKTLLKIGRLKLAVISGALLNDEKARVDILLVGDKLNQRSAAAFMRNLEADVGKELRYMLLTPQEFTYRYGMYDNFLRDIFERPHKNLVNKMTSVIGE